MTPDPLPSTADRAVERVGQSLELDGVPRMPARVFAYILCSPQDTCSAREIAQGLTVSPAAVSGAIRYLHDNRLVLRERAPGRRGERYRLASGDLWATIIRARLPLTEEIVRGFDDGLKLLRDDIDGPDPHPGVARLEETRKFWLFLQGELAGIVQRWSERPADASRP